MKKSDDPSAGKKYGTAFSSCFSMDISADFSPGVPFFLIIQGIIAFLCFIISSFCRGIHLSVHGYRTQLVIYMPVLFRQNQNTGDFAILWMCIV